ncbi:hypothetical protein SLINC_7532 [Streptomyces lincolnensis]|uniref:Uncharacterized protein n=1 Tax=Streptomyces lincolnensis TaxID=1915 RepID=A0A1B1MMC8_STRLN|nr:hypothetical protein [Streptomyces lincolnensis]ANS69756.1 hypothetical protein SLINC_7532 [Streptomyces lincolnensis]AXG58675.1 hypothetical protein SLCG_7520 [Streptomyces lincolnensis]QMV11300.1 hypothetical protein GJU35_40240 [Streptomyces lincolnensis]
MSDQSPDTGGQTAPPRLVRPPRGRHAIPRASALTRLRLPVGKALALTTLPTALILGSQRLPVADTSATVAHSAREKAPGGGPGADAVDCARPDDAPPSAAATSPSPTPSADPAKSGASLSGAPADPSERLGDEETGPAPATTATPTPSPSPSSATTGLADLLGPLFQDDTERNTPAPDANPSPVSPPPTAQPTSPSVPRLPAPHPPPSPTHRTAERSPKPSPSPDPSLRTDSPRGDARNARTCDISDLKAPEDRRAGRFSAEPWTMRGSRLDLHGLVFHGVVTVDTAAGPKRVLKFSATAVSIRDLRMSVPVGPQIQHIDGAPGSTSTLRGDEITMYVESLTGTLASVENLPTPPVLRLHLTPDTVPEWLYDTVGKLGATLRLGLNDAEIDQAGQTGGELIVPGIHGYGTPRGASHETPR